MPHAFLFFPFSWVSLTQGRLWSGTGTTRTSISFQLLGGRSVCTYTLSIVYDDTLYDHPQGAGSEGTEGKHVKEFGVPPIGRRTTMETWRNIGIGTVVLQIYDPAKKWSKYTIHGD